MKTVLNQMFKMRTIAFATLAATALASSPALARDNDNDGDDFRFDLVRSKGLANFPTVAPHAHGQVKIESVGPVEIMKVKVWGLPPNTGFDLFVIQVPNGPFGLSWYQGDIQSNKDGVEYGEVIRITKMESFIAAQGASVDRT